MPCLEKWGIRIVFNCFEITEGINKINTLGIFKVFLRDELKLFKVFGEMLMGNVKAETIEKHINLYLKGMQDVLSEIEDKDKDYMVEIDSFLKEVIYIINMSSCSRMLGLSEHTLVASKRLYSLLYDEC